MAWNKVLDMRFSRLGDWKKEFPRVAEWDRKLNERPCVEKCVTQWITAVNAGAKR